MVIVWVCLCRFVHRCSFTVLQIGLFSSLPYAFMGLFAMTSGLVADCLNFQDWTTLTIIRKLFTCCGQYVWTCHCTIIIMFSPPMLDYSL